MHELGQGPGAVPHAVQGVGDELANIVEGEGRQHDVGHVRCGRADGRKRPHQRVRGTDFVVPVGADDQQMPHL